MALGGGLFHSCPAHGLPGIGASGHRAHGAISAAYASSERRYGRLARVSPVGAARPARRGVPCTVAVTPVAALGDLPRVEQPRQLLDSLGLTPSAYSRGERRRQGSLTHAGD